MSSTSIKAENNITLIDNFESLEHFKFTNFEAKWTHEFEKMNFQHSLSPIMPEGLILASYTEGPMTVSRIFFSSCLKQIVIFISLILQFLVWTSFGSPNLSPHLVTDDDDDDSNYVL